MASKGGGGSQLERPGSAGRKVESSSPEPAITDLLNITCSKPSKFAHLVYYEAWKICSNHLSLELTINKFGLSRKIFFHIYTTVEKMENFLDS